LTKVGSEIGPEFTHDIGHLIGSKNTPEIGPEPAPVFPF